MSKQLKIIYGALDSPWKVIYNWSLKLFHEVMFLEIYFDMLDNWFSSTIREALDGRIIINSYFDRADQRKRQCRLEIIVYRSLVGLEVHVVSARRKEKNENSVCAVSFIALKHLALQTTIAHNKNSCTNRFHETPLNRKSRESFYTYQA